jgi:hypothetical protein
MGECELEVQAMGEGEAINHKGHEDHKGVFLKNILLFLVFLVTFVFFVF